MNDAAATPRNPILPADTGDRTGSAGVRRRAAAQIRRRFEAVRRRLLAIFAAIRVYETNAAADERTLYAATEGELALLSQEIQQSIDQGIAPDVTGSSWWDQYQEEAALLGAALAFANLSRIDPAYAATRSLAQVTLSDEFRAQIAAAKFAAREQWAAISTALRSDVAQIIGRAIADGRAPGLVRAEIAERVEVFQSKALQMAQSRLAAAVRDARMAEAEFAQTRLGVRLALLWASAFRPTTRPHHAARHGNRYTPAEVRAFYSQGSNRYRCYCSTTEVLVDANGQPLISGALKKSMKAQKAAWVASRHLQGNAMTDRIILVGGPRLGKSTLAREFRALGLPTFCGDPIEMVKEPEEGVTYLPSGMDWSQGSQYVAEHWFTMPGPWLCEGQIMARALRKWQGESMPSDRIIVLTNEPRVQVTPGQASMIKAVASVWAGIAHRFPAAEYLGGPPAQSSNSQGPSQAVGPSRPAGFFVF